MVQKNLEEALSISSEAENNFLALYRKSTSEDQKITINEERCTVGVLQTCIFLIKRDFLKALYACERYRMPALRKEVQLPFIDADIIINRFPIAIAIVIAKRIPQYSYILVIYTLNSVHCWIIYCDRICYYHYTSERGIEFRVRKYWNEHTI